MLAIPAARALADSGSESDQRGWQAKCAAAAAITSVRGTFSYNSNHFPIENFYLLKIEQDSDGQFVRKIQSTIFTDHKDAYYSECHMPALH